MFCRYLAIAAACFLLVHVGAMPARPANVLMVTGGSTLTGAEVDRRSQFQAWGHTVNTIVDSASQASFDAAFAVNDVVYVCEEVSVSDLTYELRTAPIGVVNEERLLGVELGFSTSDGSTLSTRSINVIDNSHPITESFSTGSLSLTPSFFQNIGTVYFAGVTASGGETLATVSGNPALFVVDKGSTLANTYSGNSTASGRRVQLPFGTTDGFDDLNSNGLTLVQKALEWAASGNIPPTLVGHWKLNETAGTTAADSSEFAKNGTVYGTARWSTRCTGVGVFNFDGSSNYVRISNASNLRPTAALTIAAWIKGDAWGSGSDVDTILRKGEGNPNNYQLAIADGRVALYLDDSDAVGIRGNTVLTPGQWYHVAAVWNGATVSIYVNGQLDNTPTARTGTIGTDTRPLYIGGRSGADLFDGMLYDVRLYNYALTAPDILKLFGLVGHWTLDETSGSTAADSSGVENDGTVTRADGTTVTSPNWADGRVAGALRLDGSTRVVIDGLMGSPANVTIAAWANLTSRDSGGSELISIGDYFALRLDDTTTTSYAFYYNGTGWTTLTINQKFEDTGWHHFAVVFNDDLNTFTIYVDGAEAGSSTITDSIIYAGLGSSTVIGAHGNGQTAYDFTGRVDDVRVYSRVLCPEEIQELYGTGSFPGVRIIKWVEIE